MTTAQTHRSDTAIVEEHYNALYRFAYSLSKKEEDASDLTQQTFYIYAQKGDSVRDPSKVKSWLFTTLYREFLRTKRKGDRMVPQENDILDLQAAPQTFSSEVLRQVDAHGAVEALEKVDPVYREALNLFYMQDLAYKDIAEVLGVPIGTVMSRLSRGKQQLKQILADSYTAD